MNWDAIGAIGELLGSLAVVVTLLYLVRQLKSSEVMATNAAQSSVQLSRLEVNRQKFENMELIVRANKGESLTEVEREQLLLLLNSEGSTMFFTFLMFRRLGWSGEIQAFNFARFLHSNPAMLSLWTEEYGQRRLGINLNTDWSDMVADKLKSLQAQAES